MARQAMPALLQMAKGQETDGRYGNELTEIFRGFGEARDEEATGAGSQAQPLSAFGSARSSALGRRGREALMPSAA